MSGSPAVGAQVLLDPYRLLKLTSCTQSPVPLQWEWEPARLPGLKSAGSCGGYLAASPPFSFHTAPTLPLPLFSAWKKSTGTPFHPQSFWSDHLPSCWAAPVHGFALWFDGLTPADCQSPGAQWPIAAPKGRTNPKSIPCLKTLGETWDKRSCNVYRRRYAHATQAFFFG